MHGLGINGDSASCLWNYLGEGIYYVQLIGVFVWRIGLGWRKCGVRWGGRQEEESESEKE